MSSRFLPSFMLCCLLAATVCRGDAPPMPPNCPAPTESPAHVTFGDFNMDAQSILVNLGAKEITADGNVTLTSPDGVVVADSARYNTDTRAGYLDRVRGCFEPFRFTAQSMTLDAKGTKQIQRARLTTCAEPRPHYELLAKDFTIVKDGHFRARNAGLAIAGHRVVMLPSIHGKIGGHTAEISKPELTGGVSGIDGTYLGVDYEYPFTDERKLEFAGRAGTAGILRGSATYTQPLSLGGTLDDGTISLYASWKEDIQNRLITGGKLVDDRLRKLTISRLPAVQVAFPTLPLRGLLTGFTLRLGAGAGRYREDPTRVISNRAQAWTVLATPLVPVGGGLLSHAEFGTRSAFYPGEQHNTNVLQLTLETPSNKARYFNISFLRRRENGVTPFLFDRVLMPDELYTEVEFPLKKNSCWWVNFVNRQDLESGTSRDYAITAIYKLDCISYGLTYDRASESLGVGLVLNAFGSFHKGVGKIGFTQ